MNEWQNQMADGVKIKVRNRIDKVGFWSDFDARLQTNLTVMSKELSSEVARRAPIDTGMLRSSIGFKTAYKRGNHLWETGINSGTAGGNQFVNYDVFQEVGTTRMKKPSKFPSRNPAISALAHQIGGAFRGGNFFFLRAIDEEFDRILKNFLLRMVQGIKPQMYKR